jgi:hypothetical protein
MVSLVKKENRFNKSVLHYSVEVGDSFSKNVYFVISKRRVKEVNQFDGYNARMQYKSKTVTTNILYNENEIIEWFVEIVNWFLAAKNDGRFE